MTAPLLPVGFDYAQALIDIRGHMTYDQIADVCGFVDKAAVARVVNGKIPRHPQGEAIWAVYLEIFGRKPPMPEQNLHGIVKVSLATRRNRLLAV